MPLYAFACNACGHQFERLQKLSDADPTACPVCTAEQVQRQLTAPQFRLSGSGWYETDFKKDGETKRNLVDSGGDAAKPAATEAKSESKPEVKAEAKPEPKPAPVTAAKATPASGD